MRDLRGEIEFFDFTELSLMEQLTMLEERHMKTFKELKVEDQERVLDVIAPHQDNRPAVKELLQSEPPAYYFDRALKMYPR